MKNILQKINFIYKKEGFFKTLKRSIDFVINYIRINIYKNLLWIIKKKKISALIDKILFENKYNRVLIWRSSLGWNIPLFQRPQHIANCLSGNECLVLYEAGRKTDKIEFIKKIDDNLYLIDYELKTFTDLLMEKLVNLKKPKYLQIYSTCWDLEISTIIMYVNKGFKILYEYIDDLNPILAGTDELPQHVVDIHKYIIDHKDILVVASADKLYNDICTKRKSKKNIILSSNGVNVNDFTNFKHVKIEALEKIKNEYRLIIGYYGALASWFDYDLVKELANIYPDIAFVMIGIKYDKSYDLSGISECKNVHYLGAVAYKDLPNHANYFDIAWIPFVINEITMSTNPLKTFEYMALNKFIISSNMPECVKYKSINIAMNLKDYRYLIDNYKTLFTKEYEELLKEQSLNNSWENKGKEIIALLMVSEDETIDETIIEKK